MARAGTFGGACREASGLPKPKDENPKEAKKKEVSEVREICVVKNTASHNKDADCKLRPHLVRNRNIFSTSGRHTNEHVRFEMVSSRVRSICWQKCELHKTRIIVLRRWGEAMVVSTR